MTTTTERVQRPLSRAARRRRVALVYVGFALFLFLSTWEDLSTTPKGDGWLGIFMFHVAVVLSLAFPRLVRVKLDKKPDGEGHLGVRLRAYSLAFWGFGLAVSLGLMYMFAALNRPGLPLPRDLEYLETTAFVAYFLVSTLPAAAEAWIQSDQSPATDGS